MALGKTVRFCHVTPNESEMKKEKEQVEREEHFAEFIFKVIIVGPPEYEKKLGWQSVKPILAEALNIGVDQIVVTKVRKVSDI